MGGFLDSLGGFAGSLEDVLEFGGNVADNIGRIRAVGARPTVPFAYSGAATLPAPAPAPVAQGFSMNSTLLLILGALAIWFFFFK